MLRPRRTGVFLGRPISAAGWKVRRSGGGMLRFLVADRGQGSRELCGISPGEEAELIGPLGEPWPLEDIQIKSNSNRGKSLEPIALIGGGVGIAPLLLFAGELGKQPFDFYAGFKSGSFGLEHIKPRSLVVSSEDGSVGVKGRITDFFSPLGYSAVFACGPEPMLKILSKVCMALLIPCFVSVERRMACGVGACLACTVKTAPKTGQEVYRHCCTDGPVFRAEEIVFEA